MNTFTSKLAKSVRDPFGFALHVAGRLRPDWLLSRYLQLARRQGLGRASFILSFDCDTDFDLEVVESVHARVTELGISPVYAVPGQLLEKGRTQYMRIAASGAEFLNHGYFRHCSYDPQTGSYLSSFFYDQLPRATVQEDIHRGHQAHLAIMGRTPLGFRAPHFGTFQAPENLRFLHDILMGMGYLYSSSTVPLYGFRRGPATEIGSNFYEIPVSGCYDRPCSILDSWSFRFAPERQVNDNDYVKQFIKMINFFMRPGAVGLLNCYADPSQVYDWPEFFECLQIAAPLAVNSYGAFIKDFNR
ncbi:MAG: polysaccharide deacetylase [Deltaproteobacteria bacterium]|nr:MAG: polysaccharide deacetylase [Deltaproteobacteria bacterium]